MLPKLRRPRVVGSLVVAVAVAAAPWLAGCSGDDGGAEGPGGDEVELGAEATRGRDLARENGCTACHSTDGRDAVGPTWQGLYGSEVELTDGSTVTADEEYLVRAIQDPNAQVREGFRPIMPERRLPEDEVQAIIAYLREIGT
jgi:cytochrome c oxidase subunit II